MNPIVVNSSPIDSTAFAALTLLPALVFLMGMAVFLAAFIFAIVMIVRFVKAHERIAKHLETLTLQPPKEPKERE